MSRSSRQLVALGDFVYDNLKFFLDFGAMPPNPTVSSRRWT